MGSPIIRAERRPPSPRSVGNLGEPDPVTRRQVAADVNRLVDLTLLTHRGGGGEVVMQPWTAVAFTRQLPADLDAQHQRTLAMHWRRLTQGRGGYEDLLDLPRHLAHLHRYDELADFAEQATQVLPGCLATAAYLADIRPLLPTDSGPPPLSPTWNCRL